MKDKICPIFSINTVSGFQKCIQNKCQFWTYLYSVEDIEIWDCCFVLLAKKNSEGKIPV